MLGGGRGGGGEAVTKNKEHPQNAPSSYEKNRHRTQENDIKRVMKGRIECSREPRQDTQREGEDMNQIHRQSFEQPNPTLDPTKLTPLMGKLEKLEKRRKKIPHNMDFSPFLSFPPPPSHNLARSLLPPLLQLLTAHSLHLQLPDANIQLHQSVQGHDRLPPRYIPLMYHRSKLHGQRGEKQRMPLGLPLLDEDRPDGAGGRHGPAVDSRGRSLSGCLGRGGCTTGARAGVRGITPGGGHCGRDVYGVAADETSEGEGKKKKFGTFRALLKGRQR